MRHPDLPRKESRLAPLLHPLEAFLSAESAGGILLLASAMIALAWANSPWHEAYHHFWHADVTISAGGHDLSMSLAHWVNDGLMVIFFLLVGLEIKREVVVGELASPRNAALPIVAALGGMIAPAAIFLALNAGGPGAHGWGIPMATDIAFAVGVVALVGRLVPMPVKVFLLAIAIVDDLGAVVVIALFYTSQIDGVALAVAGAFLAALVAMNLLGVHRPLPYILLGIGLWAATLASGIHATVAGVLLAFTIPASRQIEEQPYVEYVRGMLDTFEREARVDPDQITDDQSYALTAMEEASQAVQTPLARVEHALLRPVNFLVIPLFALANAGVDLRSSGLGVFSDPVMWGVLLGLLIGKPVGVLAASWLAIRSRLAVVPEGATVAHLVGVGVLCGIGFTMSLFVANLAYPDAPGHLAATKVGILVASLICGLVGGAIIHWARPAAGKGTPGHLESTSSQRPVVA